MGLIAKRFLNPYVQIGIGALLVTASELLLKKGAITGAHLPANIGWLGIGALASGWTWLGICTYLMSFASWLYVLRRLPLSVAFSLMTVVQILVPLGAWLFLGESISWQRWVGIACVLCGTVVVARTAAQVHGES
jgi:drug/metabolite transporter (DMT)-like permease